ncbi:hypothetical protein RYX36_000891 [Vicia faba]
MYFEMGMRRIMSIFLLLMSNIPSFFFLNVEYILNVAQLSSWYFIYGNQLPFMLNNTRYSPLEILNPSLTFPPTNLPRIAKFLLRDREKPKEPKEPNTKRSNPQPRVIPERSKNILSNFLKKSFMKPINRIIFSIYLHPSIK